CPIIGVGGGEIVPIVGVGGGRNSVPSLVSVGGGIVPHRWCRWGEEIVPHRWCRWGEE
ncbi:unnamed protein product, partial [Staurois parvus]